MQYFLFFLTFLYGITLVIPAFSNHGTTNHHGLYSGKVTSHVVVVPSRVSSNGSHVSYHLDANHKFLEQTLHYHLPLASDNFTLILFPNRQFISPNLVIERRSESSATRTYLKSYKIDTPQGRSENQSRKRRSIEIHERITHCHYQGYVKDHIQSKVALSLCNGMVGVIITKKHGEFWIEPVKETNSSSRPRRHIVFKRTSTVPDSKKKKRKKKKKHEKNCGTRQPRRQTEMKLEWQQQSDQVKVKGRERSRKNKWRRSVSKERNVEALVVADTTMVRFHEDSYVEIYLLTIMNMVSSLYQDPSIGNSINVVVVNIILLDDELDQEGLNVTINADKTLESFCKWQALQNYNGDDHPNHHDVAILITREDICARQDTPCGTLGVAHVGGMCQKERSCNVNEDNGITLAHTISHELGHNFGMYHDTEKIGCSRRDGITQHIMTPSFEADTVEVAWSSCSRRDITNFLDRGMGGCLEDKPSDQNFTYPELPPGAMYDAEYQCQLQFGSKGAGVCSPLGEICSRLWCVVDGACTTMLKPAAPGTSCGYHAWCINQECVPIGNKPEPIDGGWSDWGEWSECSRTCGAGVTIQERFCSHPLPAFGGKFCTGERRRNKICNIEACLENTPSFRAVQCSSYDDHSFHGQKYKWVPYFDSADPCELYCADTNDTIIVPWGDSAQDGTPCRVGSRDMCIRGICKHVGCDWIVDSDAQEDMCGVCHGNGDQCKTVFGQYDKELGSGYEEVVSIPAGARNIFIEELGPSKNYIGIGSDTSEEFYLNGKLEITISGEYDIAGSPGLYERDKETEKVHIPGPTKQGVIVYVIYRGKFKNAGIAFNYTIPKGEETADREYKWVFSDWSACSKTCGTGVQTSIPVCKEHRMGTVEESRCEGLARPDNKMRVCNTHQCPTRWWSGPWQLCPVTCGDPLLTMRKRTVLCIEKDEPEPTVIAPSANIRQLGGIEYVQSSSDRRYTGQELALPDENCQGQEKPGENEPCPNLLLCEEPMDVTSESILRFDSDLTDYQLGIDELNLNYPKDKYERKPVVAMSKKLAHRKQKRRRKKERSKKLRDENVEELSLILKKEQNYKQVKGHSLNQMHYNSHGFRHEFLL